MDDATTTRQEALPRQFRFGMFEADPRSGELRKNGNKIRIQEQPFQVLLMLLQRPGEVVSRDELRLRLWSNDTFVDFDHGLNTAINKLRDALGDTASNPRFVETLARRGYRFIAPVQRVEAEPEPATNATGPASSATQTEQNGVAETTAAEGQPVRTEDSPVAETVLEAKSVTEDTEALPQPHRGLTRTLFALVQVLYLAFYIAALVRIEHIHVLVDEWRGEYGLPVMVIVLVTAPVGIAIKLYLLSAVTFDYRQLGRKFRRIYPFLLPLDQLWALSPFLLLPQIGVGAAFAACAALLYLPFSERTLVRMAYRYD